MMICPFIFILFQVLLAIGSSTTATSLVTSLKDSNQPLPGPIEALDNQFPYMVSIRRTEFELMLDEGIHICAGVLIRERVVLTAAHCIFDMFGNYIGSSAALTVVAGSKYIDGGNCTIIQRRSSNVYVYPSFARDTREADLALIILDKEITPEDGINLNFINILEYSSAVVDTCMVVGWHNYSVTNISNNVLQYYVVQLYPEELCQASYKYTKNLPANQLCACPAAFGVNNNVCNNSNLCKRLTDTATLNDMRIYDERKFTPYNTSEGPFTIFNVPPLVPVASGTENHQLTTRCFPPGRNPDSGDPGSILICNNKIIGVLAYGHQCVDSANRPQIFTDIRNYSDFLDDPDNYLPKLFKYMIHDESDSEEDTYSDDSALRYASNIILILILTFINASIIF